MGELVPVVTADDITDERMKQGGVTKVAMIRIDAHRPVVMVEREKPLYDGHDPWAPLRFLQKEYGYACYTNPCAPGHWPPAFDLVCWYE
eukprot:gene23456-20382_t